LKLFGDGSVDRLKGDRVAASRQALRVIVLQEFDHLFAL
jgi:hypothetical protein